MEASKRSTLTVQCGSALCRQTCRPAFMMQKTKWQFNVEWGLIRGYHVDELCRGNFTLLTGLMGLFKKALSCPIHFSFART